MGKKYISVEKQILMLLFSCVCFFVKAQKTDFEAAERYFEGNIRKLIGSLSVQPNFDESGEMFWYAFQRDSVISYYYVYPDRKTNKLLFTNYSLADGLQKLLPQKNKEKTVKPDNIKFADKGKSLYFNIDTAQFAFDIAKLKLKRREIPPKNSEEKKRPAYPAFDGIVSPDGRYTAFVDKYNVFLTDLKTDQTIQLTFDGERDYAFGGEPDNYADISLRSVVSWFADSKKFYIVRSDNRKVFKWMRLNRFDIRNKPEEKLFSLPGDIHVPKHELYLIDTETKEVRKAAIEKWKDQKLQLISEGDFYCNQLYFIREKRTGDELDVCKLNKETGSVELLFSEKCNPYFEPSFKKLYLFNDGEDLIWRSERTGWAHFYHYNNKGDLLNPVTAGEWVVGDIVRFDKIKREIYFYGYGQIVDESPYFAKLNKASIDKTEIKCLTPEKATHTATFAPNGGYFIDCYSSADSEPANVVRDTNGKLILSLAAPDLSKLYAYGWQMPEEIVLKAADNTTRLYGYMWKPYKMEKGVKYPLIANVYPGPTSDDVKLIFDPSADTNNSLAQLGFIVVNFGTRGGNPLRNTEYRTYGYGNLRDFALEDNKYGLEQLAARYPFIDIQRVGILGHSAGGQMAFTALATYPDFYKAAVSSAGVHVLNDYNRWWGETFHGVKERKTNATDNNKGHQQSNDSDIVFECNIPDNLELAKKLKGHLLLVAGDNESNVPVSHTLRLADALVKANKNFDLWILPRQSHQYMAHYRDFYQKKVWFHFSKYLHNDCSSDYFINLKPLF